MTIEIPWKESSSSTHLTWEKTWSAHNFRICPVFCQSLVFQTLQVCGPIAAVAGFFKDTFEELNYIKMKYKNILISSHGDILLMVVDLKKHRKREHVDLICQQLLQTQKVRTKSEDPKDPSESGIESGTESDLERKSNPDDAKSEAVDIKITGSCDDAKEKLIATVAENIKRLL